MKQVRAQVKLFRALLVASALASAFSSAQPAGTASPFSRSVAVEIGGAGQGGLRDSDGRVFSDIDVRHVGLAVGHNWSWRGPLTVSLDFRYDRYDLQLDSNVVPLPENAQSIALQATLRRPLDARWTLLGSVKPGFANAGSLLDGDGAGIHLGALALYRQSEALTWAFGLLYRTPADNFELVPAIGFEWRPTEAWTATVGFPRSAITYAASSQMRLSFAALAHGGTFHVSETVGRTLGSIEPLKESLLDYTEIRLGLAIDYRPVPELELSAMVGAIVHQEFDYYERDYRLKADDPTPFVTLGARFLF